MHSWLHNTNLVYECGTANETSRKSCAFILKQYVQLNEKQKTVNGFASIELLSVLADGYL